MCETNANGMNQWDSTGSIANNLFSSFSKNKFDVSLDVQPQNSYQTLGKHAHLMGKYFQNCFSTMSISTTIPNAYPRCAGHRIFQQHCAGLCSAIAS